MKKINQKNYHTPTLTRRTIMKQLGGVAVAGLVPLVVPGLVHAEGVVRKIRETSFPGSHTFLHKIGQIGGIYEQERLAVEQSITVNSVSLIRDIVAGKYDVAMSSIDNVIAYNEAQGQVDLGKPTDLVAYMGISNTTTLPFIVAPHIKSADDLRGALIGVDAVNTGFSFALREILFSRNLMPEDYTLVPVGSSRARFNALKKGEVMGAILTPPFDGQAQALGMHKLATNADLFPDYQGGCFITTRRWAESNRETLVSFIKAKLSAARWLKSFSHQHRLAAIVARENEQLTQQRVALNIQNFMATFTPEINLAGLDTVLALRNKYSSHEGILNDPLKYLDMSYLGQAEKDLSQLSSHKSNPVVGL